VAAAVILEFEGVTTKEYDAVNKALGIDQATGEGDWPDGMISHSAGLNEDGDLVVIEVWDSPQHQARFMEERLGEALGKGGIRSAFERHLDGARVEPPPGGLRPAWPARTRAETRKVTRGPVDRESPQP